LVGGAAGEAALARALRRLRHLATGDRLRALLSADRRVGQEGDADDRRRAPAGAGVRLAEGDRAERVRRRVVTRPVVTRPGDGPTVLAASTARATGVGQIA